MSVDRYTAKIAEFMDQIRMIARAYDAGLEVQKRGRRQERFLAMARDCSED